MDANNETTPLATSRVDARRANFDMVMQSRAVSYVHRGQSAAPAAQPMQALTLTQAQAPVPTPTSTSAPVATTQAVRGRAAPGMDFFVPTTPVTPVPSVTPTVPVSPVTTTPQLVPAEKQSTAAPAKTTVVELKTEVVAKPKIQARSLWPRGKAPVEYDDALNYYAPPEVSPKKRPRVPETPNTPKVALTEITKKVSEKVPEKSRRRTIAWYVGSALISMAVLAFTGYIGIDTWLTNSQVQKVVAEKQQSVAAATVTEGGDETKITPSAIDSYKVAPDFPRVITIDSINVRARVLPMSVNTDGSIQAPINIHDAGWYTGSAKPGEKGISFIDAHANGNTREGLFGSLDLVKVGARITIALGNGDVLHYKVVRSEKIPLKDVDMSKVLAPHAGIKEGLTLMTCTGKWLKDQKTYDAREVVYTERVL